MIAHISGKMFHQYFAFRADLWGPSAR